ncbi:MAG: diguanylate cyclase response regulator [Desulfuromonadales bacterium C00003093]|nr:MAG: diguanylate cyclase response regulator [Desulfuromonadales bacterium C00003093]
MLPKILIVDNDESIRESLHEFVESAGYISSTASSADEALVFLKTNNMDVVITDIIMPEMDGLEFTSLIKKKYDADVIVMTGYSGDYSYEDAVTIGASDIIFKPIRFEELLLRLKRVLKERQITIERVRLLDELQNLAITDGLTKLYNSRYFYKQLDLEVDRFKRYHHPFSLLFIDIDHFKRYNDTYGHVEGDKVLVKLGRIIMSCLRAMDSAYRYGGEEFTIILPETIGKEAEIVAPRIRTKMESEEFTPKPGKIVHVTISIGVTEYNSNDRVSTLVRRADKAMYIAKQKGRNRICSLFADKPSSSGA